MLYVQQLQKQNIGILKICFLTASPAVLLRRYQETRRKHPLGEGVNLIEAINNERFLLQPLIEIADLVLDTDLLTIHQLRNFIVHSFGEGGRPCMMVHVISFGFKYGLPLECNFVYDVRSLPNPYFVPELRHLTGADDPVSAYLFEKIEVKEYWEKLLNFFSYTLKKSYDEGRYVVSIGIGCTGGRHRSVAFVQKIAQLSFDYAHILIKHRDINKDSSAEEAEEKRKEKVVE